MIADAHIHIGEGRDDDGRPLLNADTLLRLMDGPYVVGGQTRPVEKALVQPSIYPTRHGDPFEHHAYVGRQVNRYPDRLIGCFVANPSLDVDRTITVMRELIETGEFKAVKLHPTIHAYVPFRTRERLDPILQEAGRLGVPVLVHQGDPPFAYPSQVVPVIEDHPDVSFVLAHFGTQRVVMADEAIYVARKNENVWLETSWGDLPRIKEGIAAVGPERLLFGSDCPMQEIGSQLRNIEVLAWDSPIGVGLEWHLVEGIMGSNLMSLLSSTGSS